MRRLKSFLTTMACAVCTTLLQTHCKPDVALEPPPRDTVFYIMAGQSNMAGRGIVEAADTPTNPRLLEMEANDQMILKREPNTVYQGCSRG